MTDYACLLIILWNNSCIVCDILTSMHTRPNVIWSHWIALHWAGATNSAYIYMKWKRSECSSVMMYNNNYNKGCKKKKSKEIEATSKDYTVTERQETNWCVIWTSFMCFFSLSRSLDLFFQNTKGRGFLPHSTYLDAMCANCKFILFRSSCFQVMTRFYD